MTTPPATAPRTKTAADGTRLTYDPPSGLWLNDADLERNVRVRTAKRAVFGESHADGEPNARGMNHEGL